MPRGTKLTLVEQGNFLAFRKEGLIPAKIVRHLNRSGNVVADVLRNISSYGTKKSPRRSSQLSPRDKSGKTEISKELWYNCALRPPGVWHNCQRLLYTLDLQLDLDLAVRYGPYSVRARISYSARASTRVRHVCCQPNGWQCYSVGRPALVQ